jgi:hypothetical protein
VELVVEPDKQGYESGAKQEGGLVYAGVVFPQKTNDFLHVMRAK